MNNATYHQLLPPHKRSALDHIDLTYSDVTTLYTGSMMEILIQTQCGSAVCIVYDRNYWDVKNAFKISVHSGIRISSHDFHCLKKKVTHKQDNDDKSERLIASVF